MMCIALRQAALCVVFFHSIATAMQSMLVGKAFCNATKVESANAGQLFYACCFWLGQRRDCLGKQPKNCPRHGSNC